MREVAAERERPRCCSAAARTRSSCCAWRRRRSRRPASRSRCCTSTPGTTSPRCSRSATGAWPRLGERLVVASVQESIDAGRVREETGPRASRNRLQTVDAAGRDRGARASTPASAAPGATRSARGPRSACSRCATTSASGTRAASGPSRGTSTTPASAAASTSASFPISQLDRARRLAVHRRGGARAAVDLLRPRARGVRARRDALRRLALRRAAARARSRSATSVRYRTVGDMSCTGAVRSDAAHARRGRGGDRRDARHRARRDARRRPRQRGRDGGPQERGLLLMADLLCARHRRLAWTTASRP